MYYSAPTFNVFPFTPFDSHLSTNIREFLWVEITKLKATLCLAVTALFLRNCEHHIQKQVPIFCMEQKYLLLDVFQGKLFLELCLLFMSCWEWKSRIIIKVLILITIMILQLYPSSLEYCNEQIGAFGDCCYFSLCLKQKRNLSESLV